MTNRIETNEATDFTRGSYSPIELVLIGDSIRYRGKQLNFHSLMALIQGKNSTREDLFKPVIIERNPRSLESVRAQRAVEEYISNSLVCFDEETVARLSSSDLVRPALRLGPVSERGFTETFWRVRLKHIQGHFVDDKKKLEALRLSDDAQDIFKLRFKQQTAELYLVFNPK